MFVYEAVYGAESCQVTRSRIAMFTRKRHTLYVHARFWPGDTVVVVGLTTAVRGARLLADGTAVRFDQDARRLRLTGLPKQASDTPVTTSALECDGEPRQDIVDRVRRARQRPGSAGRAPC